MAGAVRVEIPFRGDLPFKDSEKTLIVRGWYILPGKSGQPPHDEGFFEVWKIWDKGPPKTDLTEIIPIDIKHKIRDICREILDQAQQSHEQEKKNPDLRRIQERDQCCF